MDPKQSEILLEQHIEGESRRLEAPVHLIKLKKEIEELQRGDVFENRGHEAKTLVKLRNLRVVLISLKAGAALKRHQADGAVTIHTISGRTRVQLDGQLVDLPTGQVLALEASVSHDLVAAEDSAVLLTISYEPRPTDL